MDNLWVAWTGTEDSDAFVGSERQVKKVAEEWWDTGITEETIFIGRVTPVELVEGRPTRVPWRKVLGGSNA